MADGFIAGFETKYDFNFWRPVTAIRAGDTDGNDATVADPTWSTLLNTPAIPDYTSTHSVLGGAASDVLRRFFDDDDVPFTTTSGVPFAGLTRSFTSFSQAAAENGESRIYAGIHFRSAVEDGIAQGKKIGGFVFTHALRPLHQTPVIYPCVPAPDHLCSLSLISGRFQISVSASDADKGVLAIGQAVPQGDQFGYFSLPQLTGDSALPEVVVKMADATSLSLAAAGSGSSTAA